MGLCRLGFITNFLSHPVLSGFSSAAGLMIALGQLKHVFGFSVQDSENAFIIVIDLFKRMGSETHWQSLVMAIVAGIFLYIFKCVLQPSVPCCRSSISLSVFLSLVLTGTETLLR
jgi:SulP family sulfate permease